MTDLADGITSELGVLVDQPFDVRWARYWSLIVYMTKHDPGSMGELSGLIVDQEEKLAAAEQRPSVQTLLGEERNARRESAETKLFELLAPLLHAADTPENRAALAAERDNILREVRAYAQQAEPDEAYAANVTAMDQVTAFAAVSARAFRPEAAKARPSLRELADAQPGTVLPDPAHAKPPPAAQPEPPQSTQPEPPQSEAVTLKVDPPEEEKEPEAPPPPDEDVSAHRTQAKAAASNDTASSGGRGGLILGVVVALLLVGAVGAGVVLMPGLLGGDDGAQPVAVKPAEEKPVQAEQAEQTPQAEEAPQTEQVAAEEPAASEPAQEESATQQIAEQTTAEAPASEAPAAQAPATDAPAVQTVSETFTKLYNDIMQVDASKCAAPSDPEVAKLDQLATFTQCVEAEGEALEGSFRILLSQAGGRWLDANRWGAPRGPHVEPLSKAWQRISEVRRRWGLLARNSVNTYAASFVGWKSHGMEGWRFFVWRCRCNGKAELISSDGTEAIPRVFVSIPISVGSEEEARNAAGEFRAIFLGKYAVGQQDAVRFGATDASLKFGLPGGLGISRPHATREAAEEYLASFKAFHTAYGYKIEEIK